MSSMPYPPADLETEVCLTPKSVSLYFLLLFSAMSNSNSGLREDDSNLNCSNNSLGPEGGTGIGDNINALVRLKTLTLA